MTFKNAKAQKGHQKHLHSRISYLYQAAAYLSNAKESPDTPTKLSEGDISAGVQQRMLPAVNSDNKNQIADTAQGKRRLEENALSRRLISNLRAVSLKSQIRLSHSMKHSICKRCDTLLVPGSTSTSHNENKSRGGKKAWAEMLVVSCNACGSVKRYPVGAKRQARRSERSYKVIKEIAGDDPPATPRTLPLVSSQVNRNTQSSPEINQKAH